MKKVVAVSLFAALACVSSTQAQQATTYRYDALGRLTATTRFTTGVGSSATRDLLEPADNRTQRLVANAALPALNDRLQQNESIVPQQSLVSPDGRFAFFLQRNGDLVLYELPFTILWSAGIANAQGVTLSMQPDGNMVVLDSRLNVVWSTGTAGNPGAYFIIQDDGNAVVYGQFAALWATNTCCR
jgi:YD repeat-containing protein